ncbi:bifunctional diaminohydroxyphosphoribosylaminopyrimidine deaminase/5-amino-6-(5-phosphoribosylamino)uracil reductase RibD [Defluviimonas aestuarii]|uniref:bifunctional diaminohydroxyphosphoribosylaminopyrimidine deaminase/5-amino-6-(5-phosphoribosylamino)uracil reductase RibD n=1 Tax=Albidovulum aestuarii TaxID=1130726 RepID=UPI00249BB37F|nr:bifunctional diaminohydroxyphosphoribosylaminopyrimidine deaminase/5-amino-6-(5-phosphoribosylamino)uracil reductase RibD [Defluviimonas aestuarii]MDI3337096.1 bifunctional diaminohydroxyphosphoribosylaminopyrimidine deaminase/5-amino-6-(5-phosphoribosylamino)uracil reductase RibD [Defluviimonas aestuarii]
MTPEDDRRHMAHALGLARRGLGRVWPNPAVGCVIVKDGRIVGRGWTQPGGRPHAETVALAQAGSAARGATAYVSLEPCAHHGKTPPCANALIDAGVARVVSALEDPDARVAGKGHAMLRDAGVVVLTAVMADEARALQHGFLTRVGQGRPMVTLKLAMSLDGRIATASGESKWITGPEARRRVHAMRATHDAVLVGGGTARADDPDLRVRDMGVAHQPVRVVAAGSLDLPEGSVLARTARDVPVWLVHGADAPKARRDAWQAAGARLFDCAEGTGGLDPAAMLAALGAAGLTRVFCEGGGQLAASLLSAGLIDEIALFTAGLALGADARPGLGPLGLTALAGAERFRLTSVERVGADTLSLWSKT